MSLLRKLFPRTYIARRNLVRARARSALAVLTIIIGVVAIAGLGSFGVAFKTAQVGELSELGNQVVVTPGQDGEFPMDERMYRQIERIASDATVLPLKGARWIHNATGDRVGVAAVGNPAAMYDARNGTIPHNWRTGVLVGWEFADDNNLEVGESIVLNGESFRIKAILAKKGQFSIIDTSDGVVVPLNAVPMDGYNQFLIRTDGPTEATRVASDIRSELNDRRERVHVRDFSQYAERVDRIFQQIQLFLLGVGAISLLVAGISIANVMLMSAIERREEIGVLRAVGYQRTDIMSIMLVEAMLLGLIGAVVGIALSILATMGINDLLLGDPMAFQPGTTRYALIAFGFGIGASVLAGLYPAWKASRKRPVEALRG